MTAPHIRAGRSGFVCATVATVRQALRGLRIRDQTTQLATITAEIEATAMVAPLAAPVANLRYLRGIDTVSAVTVTAEVCDFRRFARDDDQTEVSFLEQQVLALGPLPHAS